MRILIAGFTGAVLLTSGATEVAAFGVAACGDRARMVANLARKYDETPQAMGLSVGGAVVEVFAAPDGSWTILETRPGLLTCVVAAGESWQTLPAAQVEDPHT